MRSPEGNHDPVRILMVDDSKAIRVQVGAMLRKAKHLVTSADSGRTALLKVQAAVPDVVVCDLHMPEMNGVEFIEALQEYDPRIPVVILSGDGESETVLAAVHAGAFDYVVKSATMANKLLVCIDRAANSHRLTLENELLGQGLLDANARLEKRLAELEASHAKLESLTESERLAKQRTEDLERAWEEQSRFLAVMNHELRTPMHGVLGCAQVLRKDVTDPNHGQLLDTILATGDGLLKLLNDLLEYSRADAGAMQVAREPFDLPDLVDELEQINRAVAVQKGLTLTVSLESTAETRVVGDRFRLRQVMQNLLSNALKFTHAGPVTLAVSRAANRDDVVCTVRDTGIGIAPEHQDHVWGAFRQADGSTTRQFGGTGLGLAICRQLVHLMGGTVSLESAVGQGCAFAVTLPLPIVAADSSGTSSAAEDTTETLCRPMRILVAEDNPVNQLVVTRMLDILGCTAHVADNGRLALQALREEYFDAVLMDVEMPVLDGIRATATLRQSRFRGASTPVIALSASGSSETKQQCLDAGMDRYLCKPLKLRDLVACLNEVVGTSRPPGAAAVSGRSSGVSLAEKADA